MALDLAAVRVRPAGPGDWDDLAHLFGPRGAEGGCWCMFFRLPGPEFRGGAGEPNREALRRLVEEGRPTGLLAYAEGKAIGWAAVAPRPVYTRLKRSPLLVGDLDDASIWSLLCLYVAKGARRSGLTHLLIDEACAYARDQGAEVVEALPVESTAGLASGDLYVGSHDMFAAHGFERVREPVKGGRRIVMRRRL